MADAISGLGSDKARRIAGRQDRLALRQIVQDRDVCEATGQWLRVEDAVAMTVTVSPGVSRLAVVSGTHWDTGTGALSAADPGVDPDVLDGRKLFGATGTGSRHTGRSRSPERGVRGTGPVQRPRPHAPDGAAVVPRI